MFLSNFGEKMQNYFAFLLQMTFCYLFSQLTKNSAFIKKKWFVHLFFVVFNEKKTQNFCSIINEKCIHSFIPCFFQTTLVIDYNFINEKSFAAGDHALLIFPTFYKQVFTLHKCSSITSVLLSSCSLPSDPGHFSLTL